MQEKSSAQTLITALLGVAAIYVGMMETQPNWFFSIGAISLGLIALGVAVIQGLPVKILRTIVPSKWHSIWNLSNIPDPDFVPPNPASTLQLDYRPPDLSPHYNQENYRLGDAACLWVGDSPHDPPQTEAAKAKFSELSNAVRLGKIPAPESIESKFQRTLSFTSDGLAPEPSYGTIVKAVNLRRYAESKGDVPEFLKGIELLSKEDKD